MIIHHTTLMSLLVKAATRLKEDGREYDQLTYLFEEIDKISEQAEANDAEIRALLNWDDKPKTPPEGT